MGKILLLIILQFFTSLQVFSQNDRTFYGGNSTRIGVIADYSQYGQEYFTAGAGLSIEASGRVIGASYSGLIGMDSKGKFYAYTGIGQVIGGYLLKFGEIKPLALIGILTFFIPESIHFYAYPNSRSRITFYISPWGIEHRGWNNYHDETKVSGEAGLKCNVKVGDVYIEPFAGLKTIYKTERRGLSAGLTIFFTSL